MAILIIQTVDNPPLDGEMAGERWLAGDVLDVKPDDWTPGSREKSNPRFKLVKIDGTVENQAHLLARPEKVDGKYPSKRSVKIDLAAFYADAKKTDSVSAKLGAFSEMPAADLAKLVTAEVAAEKIDG